MSKYLVIVESPTKARTIFAILGSDYEVTSSMGHVVDLPVNKLAVDVEHDFTPIYHVIKGKEKMISQLKKKAKDKEVIYIATDSDREGEAIGWHIKDKLAKEGRIFYRVVFHEITEDALKEAFNSTGDLDINKVNAQMARRVLDRVVGYNLSPLLWKKIVRGLSAGRVQSVALNFIVEREKEIQKFVSKITYSIEAGFKIGENSFEASLGEYKGNKAVFETKDEALKCIEEIRKDTFFVKEIVKKETKRKPPPPYTTSLLQQDAFGKLRFTSQKTMFIAQKLYEGIQIKDAMVGLITYMRTDSFSVSLKAKGEVKEFIQNSFGENYLSKKEYHYKEKKGAQLAHEAIRPTSVYRTPQELENFLTPDEEKLYTLIWKRFSASFMKEAVFENTKVFLNSDNAQFTAEGKKMVFDGYLKVFGVEEEEKKLPPLNQGDQLILEDLRVEEHTTKPSARFNDASLVKILEEKGIGRPSTYAPTIFTLLRRNYIRREKGAFFPTDLGIKVSELLVVYFPKIMDENFTASMEEKLDEVEEGKLEWQKILHDFYPQFKINVDNAANLIQKEVIVSDKICPQCNSPLIVKWSKKGRFLSCQSFPKCKYAESITTGVPCPGCNEGLLIERRNKKGQSFYGCSKFPQCRYTSRTLEKKDEGGDTDSGDNS